MNFKKVKKAAVVFTVLSSSAGVAIAACGGTEFLVNAAVGKMSAAIVAKVASTGASIVAADNLQTQQFITSLRVLAQQIESSNDQVVNAAIEAEKSMASVNKDLADKELIDKVVVDFVSQGYNPCLQSADTKRMAAAEKAAAAAVPVRLRDEIEGAGGRYVPIAQVLKSREEQHQKLFCTQAEVDAGACSSVGKVPGGDTNASLLFSTDKTPEVVAAKNAVINNIIGLPDNPLPADAATTPEGAAYMLEKKQKDSFLAFAAYSLKSIQTENEQYKTEMDHRVGQFFGTERATAWARDQAGQSPRGVLIDLLKIQGLQLKVRERRIKQNLRTEANVALLLEQEKQQTLSPQTRQAAAQAASYNAAARVK